MINIHNIRKGICLLLVIMFIIIMSIFNIATAATYSDLPSSHWATTAINSISEKEIIKGYPDGTFKPNGTVTYAEFIKMMVVAFTGEEQGNSTTGHWATNYYNTALKKGLYLEAEIPKSLFDKKIPRADMAHIISGALGDIKIGDYKELIAGISDVDVKTQYEYDIVKVYSKSILNGYEDGTFRPKGNLSRAEAAQVLYKYITVKDGGTLESVTTPTTPEITIPEKPQPQKSITEQIKADYNWNWTDRDAIGKLCSKYEGSKPIRDFVSNFNDVGYVGGITGTEPIWGNVKYYEILEDCPYKFNVRINLAGATSIQMSHKNLGAAVALVKDGRIMVFEYTYMDDPQGHGFLSQLRLSDDSTLFFPDMGLNYKYQMPLDFDYLIFWNDVGDTAMAIKNPFLEGKIEYVDIRK